jgi:GGDEF domain-containing protein
MIFKDDTYQKMFLVVEELLKVDTTLADTLHNARDLAPSHEKVKDPNLLKDSLIPEVGNLLSFNMFNNTHGHNGIHGVIDINGLKHINNEFGRKTGDQALKQFYAISVPLIKKYSGKQWRTAGDETRVHFSTPEKAEGFAKELREELKKSPKIGGNHQISASIGLGYFSKHADKALSMAKEQLGPMVDGKQQKINQPGSEETIDHSLLNETPPEHWRPSVELPSLTHEEPKPILDTGLKVHNPIK